MYENVSNIIIKKRIIETIETEVDFKTKILQILYNELENSKLSEKDNISFCLCGYPISTGNSENFTWLEQILKKEVDFRSYREFYYCPKCDRLLAEFQY